MNRLTDCLLTVHQRAQTFVPPQPVRCTAADRLPEVVPPHTTAAVAPIETDCGGGGGGAESCSEDEPSSPRAKHCGRTASIPIVRYANDTTCTIVSRDMTKEFFGNDQINM